MQEIIPYHRPIITSLSDMLGKSHMLSNDKYVQKLEEEIKKFYDVEYAIACSSCSQGLLLSLQVAEELLYFTHVQTPTFAWFSSKWAIETLGINIHFRDINPNTWLMHEFKNTDIYLPIHTFGNIFEIDEPYTIFDGAHALGAKIRNFGLATVFSLAPTKLITACEGGIIVTNHQEIAERIIDLRNKVSRMSELNAIWGLETLKHLDEMLKWKKRCYHYYKKHLEGQFQEIPNNSNYNTIGFLTELEIPGNIEYQQYYKPLVSGFSNTDIVYEKMICLPSWYGVDYKLIVELIKKKNE